MPDVPDIPDSPDRPRRTGHGAVRAPVVAALVLAIVGVAGVGAWAALDRVGGEGHFCTLGAPLIDPPPGHEGAWITAEDGGPPGPDPCDEGETPPKPADERQPGDLPPPRSTEVPTDSTPTSEPPLERLRLGYDCAFRDVDGEVVATTTPNRSDGTCGQPFS